MLPQIVALRVDVEWQSISGWSIGALTKLLSRIELLRVNWRN